MLLDPFFSGTLCRLSCLFFVDIRLLLPWCAHVAAASISTYPSLEPFIPMHLVCLLLSYSLICFVSSSIRLKSIATSFIMPLDRGQLTRRGQQGAVAFAWALLLFTPFSPCLTYAFCGVWVISLTLLSCWHPPAGSSSSTCCCCYCCCWACSLHSVGGAQTDSACFRITFGQVGWQLLKLVTIDLIGWFCWDGLCVGRGTVVGWSS